MSRRLVLGMAGVLAACLLLPVELRAEEQVEKAPEVVVTATKTERNPADVPASITIVTKEDIEKRNIQTADEALQQVPGTYDRRGKGLADTLTSVNLRGFPLDNQKRTLVLFDGQDLSSGYTNQVNWSSIPIESIERIEVVRGPFSALYGGTAMGGVINIITRMPKKLEFQVGGGYATYDTWIYHASVGHRLWDKVSFQLDYKHQSTDGYPTNLVTKSSTTTGKVVGQVAGWIPTRTISGGTTFIIGDSGDNAWWGDSLAFRMKWDVAPGHQVLFSSLFNWTGYNYGEPNSYLFNAVTGQPYPPTIATPGTLRLVGYSNRRFSTILPGAYLSGNGQDHQQIYALTSEHQVTDRTTFRFRAGITNIPENWYTTPSSSNKQTTFTGGPGKLSTTPSYSWNVEGQVDHLLGKVHALTGGVVYKTSYAGTQEFDLFNWRDIGHQGKCTYKSSGEDRIVGVYVQDEMNWHPKVTTILGARLDWWQTYNGMYQETAFVRGTYLPSRDQLAVSPKFAVMYRPWDWVTLRTSVGTAFRPPNVYELYRTWVSSSGTTYKANPDLKPETNLGWEAGTVLKPFKGNTLTATVFQNFVDDLIYRVLDPSDPTGKTQIYRNAAEARILGLELEMTQKLWSWLEVFGNATFLNARVWKNPDEPESVGKKLTYVPRQTANFGVNVYYRFINVNLTGRYVSKLWTTATNDQKVWGCKGSYDPYFTLDTKVILTPLALTHSPLKKSYVSFSVNNLLNREYFYSYVTPGRTFWVQAGLKY
jgi:iron complex outermembrane receptor protein